MTNPGCYSGREHIYDEPVADKGSSEKPKGRVIFNQRYGWESLCDVYRDVSEAVDVTFNTEMEGIPGEFPGEIVVIIRYVEHSE